MKGMTIRISEYHLYLVVIWYMQKDDVKTTCYDVISWVYVSIRSWGVRAEGNPFKYLQ